MEPARRHILALVRFVKIVIVSDPDAVCRESRTMTPSTRSPALRAGSLAQVYDLVEGDLLRLERQKAKTYHYPPHRSLDIE